MRTFISCCNNHRRFIVFIHEGPGRFQWHAMNGTGRTGKAHPSVASFTINNVIPLIASYAVIDPHGRGLGGGNSQVNRSATAAMGNGAGIGADGMKR